MEGQTLMTTGSTWGDWIESILDRTGMDAGTLSRKTGVSTSTISKWRQGLTSAPGIDQIRRLVSAPEVQALEGTTLLDGLVAANLISPEEAGQRVSARRTPLSEYTEAEIGREINRRLQILAEKNA
jgi:transcriptional regulator with XRE-family HTH domain